MRTPKLLMPLLLTINLVKLMMNRVLKALNNGLSNALRQFTTSLGLPATFCQPLPKISSGLPRFHNLILSLMILFLPLVKIITLFSSLIISLLKGSTVAISILLMLGFLSLLIREMLASYLKPTNILNILMSLMRS